MTTQEIKSLLEQYQIAPLESLSQNFFVDRPLLDKMLNKAGIQSGDTVLEIGPGLGSLTQALLDRGCPVVAFELDKTLADTLPEILGNPEDLTVYHQDILDSDAQIAKIPAPYKVVANIPYHITGGIIRFLLTHPNRPESITLLIQKEVAEKLTTDSTSYSLQRLSVEIYSTISKILVVPKESFYPRPKIDSAVIYMEPHDMFIDFDREAVVQFAKRIFQWKRKQVASTIKKVYQIPGEVTQEVLESLGLPVDVRPEQIGLSDWVALYASLEAEMN